MGALITKPNLPDVDAVYQALIDLHGGLSKEDSLRVNARLILTLVNHIGDAEVIRAAIGVARGAAPADDVSAS